MAETFPSTLTDDLFRDRREQQENLRLQIANQLQKDPDRSRRIFAVGAVTGLPDEVIDASLDDLEKLAVQQDFNVDKWRKDSPAWASYASENPYHLSVLKEDQENMGSFERAIKQIHLGWDSSWATVEIGKLRSRQMDADGLLSADDEQKLEDLKQYQVGHEFGAENWFAKFIVKNAKMAGPSLYGIGRGFKVGALTATGTFIAGLAVPGEEVITVPFAFGLGFKGGAVSATAELERGFAYDEYLDMGLDHNTAKTAANAVGGVNAILEMVSLGAMVRHFPGLKSVQGSIANKLVGDVLVKPTMRRATGVAVARFGEVLGIEVVTEVLQESMTAITGEIIRPDGLGEPLTYEAYIDRITATAAEVMQGAFIMSTIGPAASYYTDSRRAFQAKRMETVYKALGETIDESTTRKDVPSKYKAFVERLTRDGPLKSLLIDVDRFTEYFQEQGQDPDKVANQLGIDLEAARVAGTDIEIPLDAYIDVIGGSEHHSGLLQDLKANEDQMSVREAVEWYKDADEFQKALSDEAAPGLYNVVNQEIYNTVMGELLALNFDQETADQKATFQEYVFSNLAERNNMDPIALFERYWGGVTQAVPDVLQAPEDIDIMVDHLLDRIRARDFPTQRDIFGESLTDFLIGKGRMQDVGGELAARDVAGLLPGLLFESATPAQKRAILERRPVSEKDFKGLTMDEAAELAAEAGFILERDENVLLEAIDREARGEPVFGRGADPEVAERAKALDDLADFIDQAGIDLDELTNAEVRAVLREGRTLNQIDIDEITELAVLAAENDPTLLAKALSLLPEVPGKLDFGETAFTDTVRLQEGGPVMQVSEPAQKTFDRAIQRRDNLQALLECVSGP